MKTVFLILSGLILNLSSHAQWATLKSNTTHDLNDVHFTTIYSGLAVGDNGRITTTIDGGHNWTEVIALPTCNLNSVIFINQDTGWIAGTCGIHFTSDGGKNWSQQTTGNGEELNDVYFIDSKNGWAVGNKMTILRTSNGGTNWTIDTLTSQVKNNPLLVVYFKDKLNGWMGRWRKIALYSRWRYNMVSWKQFIN